MTEFYRPSMWNMPMKRPTLHYLILVPLAAVAVYVLFIAPDVDLGWIGSLLMLGGAWTVFYLLWRGPKLQAASGEDEGEAPASMSAAERDSWVGLAFSAAILVYFALRASQMVAADGSMAPEASAIGQHIGILVIGWVVLSSILRHSQRDAVNEDERDKAIAQRATAWARMVLVVFVIGVAVTFAFTPQDHLQWAVPMVISNMMMFGLIMSCLIEYAVTALAYLRQRIG